MDEKTIARFWSKVDERGPEECWEWQACRLEKRGGYGQIGVDVNGRRVTAYAHRVAYEIANGVSAPRLLRHKCDNPPCCNPGHLIPGTHAENTDDMMVRGRHRIVPLLGESHGCAKLNDETIRQIRARKLAGETGVSIARDLGVNRSTVNRAASGKRWSHVR